MLAPVKLDWPYDPPRVVRGDVLRLPGRRAGRRRVSTVVRSQTLSVGPPAAGTPATRCAAPRVQPARRDWIRVSWGDAAKTTIVLHGKPGRNTVSMVALWPPLPYR